MAREYIESEDLLNTGRKKLNRSIDKSYDAEETSSQALKDANDLGNQAIADANKLGNEAKKIATEKGDESISIAKENEKVADEANLIAKDTNDRMNQIISGETDSAEVIDSRKPIGLDAAETLGERLNLQFGKNSDFRPEELSVITKMKSEFQERGVNPVWFGADDKGVIDSSDIFNEILKDHKHIVIPDNSVFLIQKQINLPDGIYIEGLGSNVVFKTDKDITIFRSSNKKNLKFSNFSLLGNRIVSESNAEDGNKGIYFHESSNINISGVSVFDFGAWGIIGVNSSDISIDNCKGRNSVRQSGIGLSNCSNYSVTNSVCEDNFYSGIILEPAGSFGQVTNNKCRRNKHGILVGSPGGSEISVTNNILSFNHEMGLFTFGTEGLLIQNNTLRKNGTLSNTIGHGIYSRDCKYITIKSNDIQYNNGVGIYLTEEQDESTISPTVEGNTVIKNCINYKKDNEAEIYIRKSKKLSFKSNNLQPRRRCLVITNDTEFLNYQQDYVGEVALMEGNMADIVPVNMFLNSSKYSIPVDKRVLKIKLPKDLRIIGYRATALVSTDSGVSINVDGVDLKAFNIEANVLTQGDVQRLTKRKQGDVIEFRFANTVNNTYTVSYEIEILHL